MMKLFSNFYQLDWLLKFHINFYILASQKQMSQLLNSKSLSSFEQKTEDSLFSMTGSLLDSANGSANKINNKENDISKLQYCCFQLNRLREVQDDGLADDEPRVEEDMLEQMKLLIPSSRCTEHRNYCVYTCINCQINLCGLCFMDSSHHKGHRFRKFFATSSNFKEEISFLSQQIQSKRKGLESSQQMCKSKIFEQKGKEGQKIKLLEKRMKDFLTFIQNQKYGQNYSPNQIFEQDYRLRGMKEFLQEKGQVYQILIHRLQISPKVKLLTEIGEEIKEIVNAEKNETQKLDVNKNLDFEYILNNDLTHSQFESQIYTIQHYDELREGKEEFISDIFTMCNNKWRMKVYPGGYIQAGKAPPNVEYLSIYLERVDGMKEKQDFMIRVELMKPNVEKVFKTFMRKQFQSSFQRKESWGYDKFTRVNTLFNSGIVTGKQDSLTVRVSIAYASFYHAHQDLTLICKQKQNKFDENRLRIQKLKEELARSENQNENEVKEEEGSLLNVSESNITEELKPKKIEISKKNNNFIQFGKNSLGEKTYDSTPSYIKYRTKQMKVMFGTRNEDYNKKELRHEQSREEIGKSYFSVGKQKIERNSISLEKKRPSIIRLVSSNNLSLIEKFRQQHRVL